MASLVEQSAKSLRQGHHIDEKQPILCQARGCGTVDRSGIFAEAEYLTSSPQHQHYHVRRQRTLVLVEASDRNSKNQHTHPKLAHSRPRVESRQSTCCPTSSLAMRLILLPMDDSASICGYPSGMSVFGRMKWVRNSIGGIVL